AVIACQRAMERASESILKGFRLRTDARIFRYPERYTDGNNHSSWDTVFELINREATKPAATTGALALHTSPLGIGVKMVGDIADDVKSLVLRRKVAPQVPAQSCNSAPFARSEFLRGHIPLVWLTKACTLSGRTPLATALAVWFHAGRKKCKD